MGKYLKMADVFDCEVDSDAALMIGDSLFNTTNLTHCIYAAHAINSHDELVAEVERLTSSLNHANSNHELFERQYYLEKDKCEDLQAEVERLRRQLHFCEASRGQIIDQINRMKRDAFEGKYQQKPYL